jgi:hypothetical protein
MPKLTLSRARQALSYDPLTGRMTWLVGDRCHKAGRAAGGKSAPDGYLRVCVDGEQHLQHRVAFLLMTGRWPREQIDHIDLNRSNNSWANLREATNKQNMENRGLQANNTSGYVGVSWYAPRGKWVAGIKHNGKRKNLGYFADIARAAEVRRAAELRLFTHAPEQR